MNRYLLILSLIITSCGGGGGDLSNPCGGLNNSPIKGNNLGNLQLNNSSLQWVNFDTSQSVNFVNSKGFKSSFDFSKIINDSNEQVVSFRFKNGTSPCYVSTEYDDYGYAHKQYFQYVSKNLALNFDYIRYNIISGVNSDSIKSLYGTDYFSLMINTVAFEFPFNQKSPIPFSKYYDSLKLGNVYYKNVYESYTDPTKIDTNVVTITGTYYNQSKGILGFYYSNGEKWWLQ